MMGPDALESDGLLNYGTAGHKVIGTGPFMLQEWIPGDHITLVKNENYSWGAPWFENRGAAKIDKVIYRIITDQTARFTAFESGEIDVLQQVPPNKVPTYQADPDKYTVITGRGQGTYHVEFNCNKTPFTNESLRKAFGYAINRTQILDTVWYGIGEEGVNYLSPIEPESRNVPAIYNYSYDVDKAKALFEMGNYKNNDTDAWLENLTTNEELTLHLLTTTKGEDIAMSQLLQIQFQAVGVHVQLTTYTETILRDKAAAGEQEAILFWYSWPRAEILDWHFGTWAAGGSNTGWYMDSVFDDYVTNWTYATTEKQFSDNATAGHIRLLTQGPWAPILFWYQIFAVHNYVKGWTVNPLGQEQVINIVDVDIKK
jgi:peptide/nickel transport system substrate-binding protein